MRGAALTVVGVIAWSCAATTARPVSVPAQQFPGTDGVLHSVPACTGYTVLEFFSRHCDVQAAHDARLIELARRFSLHGVAFLAVDSEVDATAELDRDEVTRRGYPYPIVIDAHAQLAHALGAEYSTYSVLLDSNGRVHYRGGVDADQVHLRQDTTAYLADAVHDVLAGREPRRVYGKALGCSLRIE